jgi:hypothetical protein
MNITKKQWMIIGVVAALIAIWYFFLRKKTTESGFGARTGRVGASMRGGNIANLSSDPKSGSICCCQSMKDKNGYCPHPTRECCLEAVAGEPMTSPGGVA